MREVTKYVAWDDSEFDIEDECLLYESAAMDAMREVNDCYIFFNKDGERFEAPPEWDDIIENWLNWLSNAAEHCARIKVNYILPEYATQFIDREWGYCIAPEDFYNETGLFKYDDWKNRWVKVDE